MQPVATRSLKTSRTSVTEIYRIYSLCGIHVSFFKLLSAESFWAGLSEGFTAFAFHSITILSSSMLFRPIQSTQVICCIVSWTLSVIIYIYIYPFFLSITTSTSIPSLRFVQNFQPTKQPEVWFWLGFHLPFRCLVVCLASYTRWTRTNRDTRAALLQSSQGDGGSRHHWQMPNMTVGLW